MALTLPVVLALYAMCLSDRAERHRTLVRIIPYGLVALLYFGLRQAMFGRPGLTGGDIHIALGPHFLAIAKTIGLYLGLLALPFHLNAERAFFIPQSVLEPAVFLSLAFLTLLVIVFVRIRQRLDLLYFAMGLVLVTLLPVANIIFLETRPIAEQRLYLPSFGFCLLVAVLIQHLRHTGSKSAVAGAWLLVGLLMAAYGLTTIRRNFDWRDPLTFYTRTLQANPDSPRIHNNLGIELSDRGRHREAIAHFETALRKYPTYTRAMNNLGVELERDGRVDEAVALYEKALGVDPAYVPAHYNLAMSLLAKGHTADAIRHFHAVVKLDPDHVRGMNNLGLAYYAAGNLPAAMDWYLAALRVDPDYDGALYNLGVALTATENIDAALGRLRRKGLTERQEARVYNSMAAIYLQQERVETAVSWFRRALAIDPADTDVLYNLGLALIGKGAYQEAADVFSRLLDLVPGDQKARQRYIYCLKMAAAGAGG